MTKNLIIVLSYKEDLTAQEAVESLKRRHVPVAMVDAGDFPLHLQLDAQFHTGYWHGTLCHEGTRYPLEEIRSILYRRPTHYRASLALPSQIQTFCENEAEKGLGGLLRSLDCLWISHPDALRAASYKPRQLQAASRLGLRVPRTCITNDPSVAKRFYHECNGNIITKTLYGGNVSVDQETWDAIYTSCVTPESLAKIDRVRHTATFFQEHIEKEFELRITIVGQQVFTAQIFSQHAEKSRIDFRASYADLKYAVYQLPPAIAQACIDLVRGFSLAYGTIDMAVTPTGDFIFFELNPGGQFQWIEFETKMPITETIVDMLVRGNIDE